MTDPFLRLESDETLRTSQRSSEQRIKVPLSIRLPLALRKRIEVLLLIRPPLPLGRGLG